MNTPKDYNETRAYLVQLLREGRASGDSPATIASVMAAACYTVGYIYGVNPVSVSTWVFNTAERGVQ